MDDDRKPESLEKVFERKYPPKSKKINDISIEIEHIKINGDNKSTMRMDLRSVIVVSITSLIAFLLYLYF